MKRFLSFVIALVMVLSMIPAVSFAAQVRMVYVDPANGLDTNNGLTESAPVQTIAAAYAALDGASEGKIVLLGTLTLTEATTFPTCQIPVTLTSKTGSEGIQSSMNIFFGGDTTLENMTLTMAADNNTTYLSGEGHDLTIGDGITTKATYSGRRFCLTLRYTAGSMDGATLTVNAGNWRSIFYGGYKEATTGDCTLIMNGGNVNNIVGPTYSGTVTGNTAVYINGGTINVFDPGANTTGSVKGNVDVTVTGGTFTKFRPQSARPISGTVTVTLDGDCSGIKAFEHKTGSVGGKVLVLKSGSLSLNPGAFDEARLEIPQGKTFTLEDCALTVDSVNSAGTLIFSGGASLNAKALEGSLACDISGTPAESHIYVTAPASATVTFPESLGITGENGVWQSPGAFDEATFKGLVIRADKGVSVNLYSGYKANTGTKQTPVQTVEEEDRISYYYELAVGAYRCVTSRSGYYKVTKDIYMSSAEVATCTEHIVKMDKRAGGTATDTWEPVNYQAHTDEVLALEAYDDDLTQWPAYADVFTTPWFTEEHAAQQTTTQSQAEAFIEKLDDENDNMYVYSIGKSSGYGHDVWAVFFTQADLSGAETYEEAVELMGQDKPAVLYRAQVHGNEPAAGEAALAILQRLDGVYGNQLTENINVIVVPRASPDGARNFARTLTSGVDPNRDMLRLESQEIRDYLKLYQLVEPELVIDGHEYDGYASAEYHWDSDITVGLHYTGNNTQAYAQTNMELAQGIFAAVEENGLTYNYYGSRANSYNDVDISRPYFGQMGSLSILLETRGNGAALVSYARRIVTQVISVEYLLSYVSDNAAAVQQLVDAERQQIVEKGKTYRADDQVYLYIANKADESLTWQLNRIYQNGTEKLVTTTPGVVNDVKRARTAPTAYLIPAGAPYTERVLALMDLQGIAYTFLPAGSTVKLQQYTGTVTEAFLTDEKSVTFGAGAYVFTMDQIPAYILASLMEPDVDDVADNAGTLVQQGIITAVNGEFPIYRYCYDLNAQGFINYTQVDAEPIHTTVYLDSTNGLDTYDGLSEATAVKTMEQAYAAMAAALQSAGEGSTGTVVICGMYDMGKQIYNLPSVGFHVTITGKTGEDGFKYTGASVTDPINRSISLHGDTTFENLTIFADSGYAHNLIIANGHKLVIGEGVNSICREGKDYHFSIVGGGYYETDTVASTDVTVKSGTWRSIYAGNYNGKVTGTAKLTVSNATVYADIVAARMANIGKVEMHISNTTLTTGSIYAGTMTANTVKNLGTVENGVTITLGENVVAANLYCSAKTYGKVLGGVTVIADGVDLSRVPVVARCPELSASYPTAQIQVVLAEDMATPMTLESAMVLDLNGHHITGAITVDGTLKVKDSQTDDHSVSDGVYGNITGQVTGTLAAETGYVMVDNQSFHKLDQRITAVSIRPSIAGIYYNAGWLCDEVLAAEVKSFGLAVSTKDAPAADFATDGDTIYTVFGKSDFASGKEKTSAMIADILKSGAADNDARGKKAIYAVSYITFEDGTSLVGEAVEHSLCSVMLLADETAYEANASALNAFYATWEDVMKDWGFANIGK